MEHCSVLLHEAVDNLQIKSDGIYIDLTFGRGGHSAEILQKLGPEGHLLAVDRDPQAVKIVNARPEFQDSRFAIEQCSFSHLSQIVSKRGWQQRVDGILMDLGVSSPQLDQAERGFSFLRPGPLDMRMDPHTGLSAGQWLNSAEESDISRVLKIYGEERLHRRIAQAIVQQRAVTPLSTTTQLADLVESVYPNRHRSKHPATKVFQAVRIFINDELAELRQVLEQSLEVLSVGGRICIISFHSLEDRIAKKFIQSQAQADPFPAHIPIKAKDISFRLKKVGGLIRPSQQEVDTNPRARSARLRVAEKL